MGKKPWNIALLVSNYHIHVHWDITYLISSCQEAEKLDWTGVQVVGGEANPQADSFYTYLLIIVVC